MRWKSTIPPSIFKNLCRLWLPLNLELTALPHPSWFCSANLSWKLGPFFLTPAPNKNKTINKGVCMQHSLYWRFVAMQGLHTSTMQVAWNENWSSQEPQSLSPPPPGSFSLASVLASPCFPVMCVAPSRLTPASSTLLPLDLGPVSGLLSTS